MPLSLAAASACAGGSHQAPAPKPVPARVLSNYERVTGNTIPRDCGYSSPMPGRPGCGLWLFCDTAVASAGDGRIEHRTRATSIRCCSCPAP